MSICKEDCDCTVAEASGHYSVRILDISHLQIKSAVTSSACRCPGNPAAKLENYDPLLSQPELLFSLAGVTGSPELPDICTINGFSPTHSPY